MKTSLRTKLFTIVGSTALAFVVVLVTHRLVTRDVERQLLVVQDQQIPRLEIGPKLEADFAALKRGYQDAVAAHDAEALERTRQLRDRILERVEAGRAVLDAKLADDFSSALRAYSDAALDVAHRMMANQAGEDVVDAMASMQQKQARAQELLDRLVLFDQNDLKAAFDAAHLAETRGAQRELAIIVSCLGLVFALSLRSSRHIAGSLATLQAGIARFGEGRFGDTIVTTTDDEIAMVAKDANRMAQTLAAAATERELRDWVKSGLMDLGEELRGELEEADVARRAARSLARRVGAAAAAVYVVRGRGKDARLRLLGQYALTPGAADGDARDEFVLGEGLVGEAACASNLVVIDDLPDGFLRVRSGLGEATPPRLVLVPLLLDGKVTAILELAMFTPLATEARELLDAGREAIAIALAVAESRAATRALLAQTQRQAAQMAEQEEELKATNEELRCQQEELRQTNEELGAQRGELQTRNTELQEVGRRLEQKAAELASVSAYKSQFLANMSHELRTPLNSMLLLSKLLEENADGRLTPKETEYARTIHGAGKDLLQLINQVLDLAKIEAGKQRIEVESMRLEDLADRMRRTFEPLAADKRLRFDVTMAPGLPETIMTDPQRVAQIVTNLLGNAIKFTDKGAVALRIERPLDSTSSVAIIVSDTGAGIAPAHQARVFEPFEQVDGSTQRKQGGTGLGLGIARELTTLLGGELRLESDLGRGSTFTCILPEQTGKPLVAAPRPVPAKAPEPPPSTSTELLVIEDDVAFAGVLHDLIRERGLVPVMATDGETGLRLARERRPRGIILDVTLPDTDGWRVMEEIRRDPATSGIPVHFISGIEAAERGIAAGAAGYLMKPAERPALLQVIETLGRRAPSRPYNVLVVEPDAALGQTLVAQLSALGLTAMRASTTEQARAMFERETYTCLVLDLEAGGTEHLEILDEIEASAARRQGEMPAVVIYTSRPLNRDEAARLERYAEAVVLKEGASTARLIDEIRLFVRRLEAGLPRRSETKKVRDIDVRLGGKQLLVVDDDMRTVYALSAMLRARGAEVLVAENGAIALNLLGDHPNISAVLMDVMMPVMDGYEATRRIRAQERFASLPIIALTAKAMRGDLERCLEAGATDYLPKPIDGDALLAVLHTRVCAPAA